MTLETITIKPGEAIEYLKAYSQGNVPDCHLHVTGPLSLKGEQDVEQITRLPSLISVEGDLDLTGAKISNYNDVRIQSGTSSNTPLTGVKISGATIKGDLVIKGVRTR